jgi:hypothetical protein
LACLLLAAPAGADPRAPALDPPAALVESDAPLVRRAEASASAAQVEWTLHATSDGQHPDANEQEMLWLMNRARQDPAAEGVFLATVDDAMVHSALGYFGVLIPVLEAEFVALAPKPPAAFDARLYEAAYEHSLYLIANDTQSHDGQLARIADAGFHASVVRGNVYSYAESALYSHAGFNVDWGSGDGTGMQAERGHRQAVMSIDGDYTNVGLAVVPEWNPATQVGPLVVTGDYAHASSRWDDHYNRFVVGTVWEDRNGNGRYDPGEGFAGVTVTPDAGPYFAVTSAGGGYAIPVLETGSLALTFSGSDIPTRTEHIDVADTSILLDYDPLAAPEPDTIACAGAALFALALATKRRGTRRDLE